jgi:peptidoglycan/xylan/chitin deacetylase (PgdA/CDA1 family)
MAVDPVVGWKPPMLLVVAALASGSCSPIADPGVSTTVPPPTSTTTLAENTTAPGTTSAPATTTTSQPITTASSTIPTAITTTTAPQEETAHVVTRVATDERVILLTFDAGSDRGFAAEILDALARHGIKASFGITGRWAESNPDLLQRMVQEGHALMNHTYDHPHMETLSADQRLDQLARAEEIINGITGATTRPYFRPPYGSYNDQVLIDVASAGYRYAVMWTVDCLGWKGLPPGDVVARCENALQPGAVLLMHVGAASTDYAALDDVIAAIDEGGYRYATITELLP